VETDESDRGGTGHSGTLGQRTALTNKMLHPSLSTITPKKGGMIMVLKGPYLSHRSIYLAEGLRNQIKFCMDKKTGRIQE